MFRFLFLVSSLVIAAALGARWYFGLRILASDGGRGCRCDLTRWLPAPGDTSTVHRAEETAAEFGRQLRLKALAEWKREDPKAIRSRATMKRFSIALPPFAGIILILAILSGRLPGAYIIPAFLTATAAGVIFSFLPLTAELAAITKIARRVRKVGCFPQQADEEAVVRCATAFAWKESIPPILSHFQR